MFLDTSAIVELFKNEPKSQRFQELFNIIGSEPLYISIAQLGEITDWCFKNGHDISDLINLLACSSFGGREIRRIPSTLDLIERF